ncbi:MAG TPA: helix-hairpin-helix domain-containing protein [Gemmatimonadaceae bacterium]|nr:helix-hairpin-helix domain-containing protein [Gemmatimonadaceae bacterium]
MPTPGERRALVVIAAVAALGVAARGWKELRGPGTGAPLADGDRAGLARQIEAVDSAIAAGGDRRRGRGGKDKAVASPRGTARRKNSLPAAGEQPAGAPIGTELTVKSRRSKARPSPAAALPPRDPHEAYRQHWERADSVRRSINARDGFFPNRAQPGQRTRGGPRALPAAPTRAPVDLDTAPLDEIASVPQIGPALARRIVADRTERGPFGSLDGLARLRGMSRGLVHRLQPYVTFSLASRLESAPEAIAPVRRRRRTRMPILRF